jgi:hypothetical protein
LLFIILTVTLPFQGFNAIAMEKEKYEEIESSSGNGIRVRNHNRNLQPSSEISEEERKREPKKSQWLQRYNFYLKALEKVLKILMKISELIINHS